MCVCVCVCVTYFCSILHTHTPVNNSTTDKTVGTMMMTSFTEEREERMCQLVPSHTHTHTHTHLPRSAWEGKGSVISWSTIGGLGLVGMVSNVTWDDTLTEEGRGEGLTPQTSKST